MERRDERSMRSSRTRSDGRPRDASRGPSRAGSTTRRHVLAATGSAVVGATTLASAASAQEETTTDDDTGARITTTMAIEDVPEFDGPYGSQFVVIQSTEYSPERTPGLEDCSGVDWNIQNTKSHDGAIIDRVSQSPEGFQTTIHIAAEDREFRPGQTFVVSDVTECGDYVALGVEGVGPLSLAGKEAVGTGTGDGAGGDAGGSIPGFTVGGALAGVAALLGAGAARRVASDDDGAER
ncbi:hypothetical protein G9C85_18265 [Halorubellus sp. JP-L1]|uniref:hypothetical protein n=1 Tax=Halorubellus sp. JP-L1 TaxID=2715753 RepID=UPI00140B8247|nr:hypothetical protein [Halorubellus sp. JP-L1]NHN43567.1 hypothetical protein [Halorubellus sp. JP-L1]